MVRRMENRCTLHGGSCFGWGGGEGEREREMAGIQQHPESIKLFKIRSEYLSALHFLCFIKIVDPPWNKKP